MFSKSSSKFHWIYNLYCRYRYGAGCCDCHGLCHYLGKRILPALKEFRKKEVSTPMNMTMKEWHEVVDKMIWSFQYLADGEPWDCKDFEVCKRLSDKEQEGFELFGKYFRDLWLQSKKICLKKYGLCFCYLQLFYLLQSASELAFCIQCYKYYTIKKINKKIVSLKNTCIACPSQWEGKLEDGNYIYIRYRGDYLGYGIEKTIDEAVSNHESFEDFGDFLDGYIDESTMMQELGLSF